MVDEMVERFSRLEGKLPPKAHERIMERLAHQKEHAREWRDQINAYFIEKLVYQTKEEGKSIDPIINMHKEISTICGWVRRYFH